MPNLNKAHPQQAARYQGSFFSISFGSAKLIKSLSYPEQSSKVLVPSRVFPATNKFVELKVTKPRRTVTQDEMINALKERISEFQAKISATNDNDKKEGLEASIKDLNDFIKLAQDDMVDTNVKYIEKTNEGNGAMGVGILLLGFLSNVRFPFSEACKETIKNGIYSADDPSRNIAKFEPMEFPFMFAWWEEGEVKQEPFGMVSYDKFKGFVKVAKSVIEI